MSKLSLVYYGHVFDASGYGNAARAYIHALHGCGIELQVRNLSRHAPQVRDPLIESLTNHRVNPDFHLFHGIPLVWAAQAFRLRDVIAMTVWETDTMPTQWRGTLNHAVEVWLPCEFNVATFKGQIAPPVSLLPHPLPPCANSNARVPTEFLNVMRDEFVVYSIFEWQDRKGPNELMDCYLRAFPSGERSVLIVKTNHSAADVARRALDHVRARTGSRARVDLRCESWSDDQVHALHQRGDCYVSLHRGEGWCYPLFDAACHGKPVVATAYSGPLDYLDPKRHHLVSYRLVPVLQQYRFYSPRMNWAQPDVDDAIRKLRYVYENRDVATNSAIEAAADLRRRFAPAEVGTLAKSLLMNLLARHNRARWSEIRRTSGDALAPPALPVPPSWYDHDYFETGLKSNWTSGYRWEAFSGLFRETVAFLTEMLPNAASILDAGCAKGFLVKALRESQREAFGFDHSRWAIDHAEPDVRPYLTLAGVDHFVCDREYDLLVALHLFPQLTEEQTITFLQRMRPHIRVGLLAVIPVAEAHALSGTGDLGHVTLKPREWWHAIITAAGWKRDSLHQSLEAACARHRLATRMGWSVFLYAP